MLCLYFIGYFFLFLFFFCIKIQMFNIFYCSFTNPGVHAYQIVGQDGADPETSARAPAEEVGVVRLLQQQPHLVRRPPQLLPPMEGSHQ